MLKNAILDVDNSEDFAEVRQKIDKLFTNFLRWQEGVSRWHLVAGLAAAARRETDGVGATSARPRLRTTHKPRK